MSEELDSFRRRASDWEVERGAVVGELTSLTKSVDGIIKGQHDMELQLARVEGELKASRELTATHHQAQADKIEDIGKRVSAITAAVVTLAMGAAMALINAFINGHFKVGGG